MVTFNTDSIVHRNRAGVCGFGTLVWFRRYLARELI